MKNALHMRDQKGFSLLEVLIAIAVLSFIVIAILSVTGSSQDTALRVVSEDREILQVETAMARIEWDVSQIYSPLYFSHAMESMAGNEAEGAAYNQLVESYAVNSRFAFPSYEALPVPRFELEEKSAITLLTTSNRRKFKDSKQSHFAWVRYQLEDPSSVSSARVENEEEEKGQVLTRKFAADDVFSSEPMEWDKIKSQVLLRRVQELAFEFWNPETRKWADNLATIKNGLHLVRGVKLTLKWLDPDGVERTFIRVFRPLFPEFKPENMYQLIQQAQGPAPGQRPGQERNRDSDRDRDRDSGRGGESDWNDEVEE